MYIQLACGIIGSILMAASDWIMIYGDTTYEGKLKWLTRGVANIPSWRNNLALALAIPAVILYAIALLEIQYLMNDELHEKIYATLTIIGMTPWLCIHLFYVMILYAFSFLHKENQSKDAYKVGEQVFSHFAWLIIVGEIIMLLPFVFLIYAFAANKTLLPRAMAANTPILILVLLKLITLLIKDCPFKLAFTNGLMSESMIIWFIILMIFIPKNFNI